GRNAARRLCGLRCVMQPPAPVQIHDVRWHVDPALRPLLFDDRGLRLGQWLASGQATIIKQAPHRTIYQVDLPELRFFVKHYPILGVRSWIRQLVRPSKARGEYERALAIAQRGIPTVVPLALGERGAGWWPGESYLLTCTLDNTEPLNCFLETRFPALPQGHQTVIGQRLAVALGRLVAQMHDAGIMHHDLH